jgi:beta-lysine 5,6-aminomutase alpha subunit
MPGPFVDDAQVAQARGIASQVIEPVFDLIRRHTTISVERTVLRLFGMADAGPGGIPLTNLMTDRLKAAGVLNRGAAYWYGRALQLGRPARSTPWSASPRCRPSKLGPLSPEVEGNLREEVAARPRPRRRAPPAHRRARRAPPRVPDVAGAAPLRHRRHRQHLRRRGPGPGRAQAGADIIAVIRSTAQSLLDYVPHGATTEGYGGTYATQENFRIMREALDAESRRLKRYIQLTNYSSGLCMAEIAFAAAWEKLDMLLNDAMYGILFRDINMRRTFIDQYFSRRICALAGIIINTGEDNYITTADAYDAAHTVIASQFINEAFAKRAGLQDWQLGLGHSYEIDPHRPGDAAPRAEPGDARPPLLPDAPLKYMPPTKHKETDIFFSHAYDVMADLVAVWTRQGHPAPGDDDRGDAHPAARRPLRGAQGRGYIHRAARGIDEEFVVREDGKIANRRRFVFGKAMELLEECRQDGLVAAIGQGRVRAT